MLLCELHEMECLDDAVQKHSLTDSTRAAHIVRDVDNMNVKMVIRRLIMNIDLQLISIDVRVFRWHAFHNTFVQVFEESNVSWFEVSDGSNISTVGDSHEVH